MIEIRRKFLSFTVYKQKFKSQLITQTNFHIPSNLYYKAHPIPKVKWFSSRLSVVFVQSIEARCWVENKDVVGVSPTGGAPTTSEWSTTLLSTKMRLILDVWRYTMSLTAKRGRFSLQSTIWYMKTSSNGNIFCVTGPLCGEFTGHIPRAHASDTELWCFLWSAPE